MTDPRDELVERVAQIVYEAMRFDRENYTPPWQNGNSLAEDEARATAARLRAVALEEAAKLAEAKADSEECKLLTAENEKLRAALRYALKNGIATQYHGDDDDCGTHSCCGEVSYKPHEAECWTMKARAALEEK